MKTRFAILGFGNHARRRLVPAFEASRKAELTGLWRRDASAAAADAEAHGLRAYGSAEELCADPEVDAVFITSPDAMHLQDAKLAFAHGKAVICEKPLAMNAGQAGEMLEAAERAGCVFGVGQNFRFNRSLQLLRKRVLDAEIGAPLLAHAEFDYPGTLSPRKWITDATLACGGPMADVGIHCIDALRFVLGDDVKSISVLATQDDRSGEVDATAAMQMQMRRGTLADVTVSARAPYRTLLEIVGEKGALIAENALTVDRPVEIQLRRGGELVEMETVSNSDGYVLMLDAFCQAMRGEGEFAASGSDGLVNQRILDAAYRSWRSGMREML